MENTETYTIPPQVQQPQGMSDEELKKTLNIPERDTVNYPEIPKEVQVKAGTFLYKLNLLASSADGNLQSLVWDLYDKMDDFLHLGLENSSLNLAQSLENLKEYLDEHDNILFHEFPQGGDKKQS